MCAGQAAQWQFGQRTRDGRAYHGGDGQPGARVEEVVGRMDAGFYAKEVVEAIEGLGERYSYIHGGAKDLGSGASAGSGGLEEVGGEWWGL